MNRLTHGPGCEKAPTTRHVMRRDHEYVGRKMMEMELLGKRRRRPKKRFLDVVKEDVGEVDAKETDVEDRKVWRMMIRCGHP